MPNDAVIETNNLTMVYRRQQRALDGLTMHVERGQVYGFVGANGSGKTTTFKLLLGLLRAKRGKALLLGQAFGTATPAIRSRIAAVSQAHTVYPDMSLDDLFRYLQSLYPRWDQAFAKSLSERFQLSRSHPLETMSGGQQRRAAILLALATRAEVILLDEPAANLDPVARRTLLEELADTLAGREDTTVMFSTHILSDLERIADTVGLLNQGKLTLQKSTAELSEQACKVQVIFENGEVPADFGVPNHVGKGRSEGAVFIATAMAPNGEAFKALENEPGIRLQRFPLPLEDAIIQLMEHAS